MSLPFMATRYLVLVRVLDQLRQEAPPGFRSYHPAAEDAEGLNIARAKAFLHLFLKVYFGILDFSTREQYVTEGPADGGIDAYFIDSDRRTIYFVQSKFRQSERNFEEKNIEAEELLKMDVDRILNGEATSESGQPYNHKIQDMTRRIREIEGIARYNYRIIILANVKGVTRQKLTILTGGFQTEVFDYHECYRRLLFPLVSGSFFNAEALHLSLNLSNKNATSKISYTASTEHGKCEITVVFVPTLEIAKAMFLYRNAILKYNPRSYLEFEGQNVNKAIRNSVEGLETNEFALFNNGITVLSDETYLNERIGQKDRAQLTLINPQIINGGQTAYTLSQIYKDHIDGAYESVFGEKEVLLKVITFDHAPVPSEANKRALIEAISRATNSQTTVTAADRRSNEPEIQQLQQKAFEQLGLFIERKRGEFTDGIREGYIALTDVVDRNIFLRAALVVQGRLDEAFAKKIMVKIDFNTIMNVPDEVFQRYASALAILRLLQRNSDNPCFSNPLDSLRITQAWIALYIAYSHSTLASGQPGDLTAIVEEVTSKSEDFRKFYSGRPSNFKFIYVDNKGRERFHTKQYLASGSILNDALEFYGQPS